MSMVRMWGASSRGGTGNDQSDDGSTVVSQQTVDSWGGLAPPHRTMPYAPSETVRGTYVTNWFVEKRRKCYISTSISC